LFSATTDDHGKKDELEEKPKRDRRSKKEIEPYKWNERSDADLADFIKEHPELFDKRNRNWLNKKAKDILWGEGGSLLDPKANSKLLYIFIM